MYTYQQPSRSTSAREAGIVSIMVTMILMIVISLIVLGFAQISRRNQRQSLDRQLSTQAFYAAETGINDVRQLLNSATGTIPAKPTCASGDPFYALLDTAADVDSVNNVKYTCIIVDPEPKTLKYDTSVPSTIIPVISGGANIAQIKLTWGTKAIAGTPEASTPTVGCPTATNQVFGSSWACGYGVLRFDLVPTGTAMDALGFQNATMTSFVVPMSGGTGSSTIPYAAGNANLNNRVGTVCTDSNCSLTITVPSANQYYLRVASLYKDNALTVSATDASGAALPLKGAQAVIDATGKAQDVLRRVQVHVSPSGNSSKNQLSDFSIMSTDSICKRFLVMNGYFGPRTPGVTSTNPLCQPS